MAAEQDLFSDPFGGVLTMKLVGTEFVGFIKFYLHQEFLGGQVVPENPWNVLRLLVDRTKAEPIASFMPAKQMVLPLSRKYGMETDAQNVIITIWRLRNLIKDSAAAAKLVASGLVASSEEFVKKLIQHQPSFGYRLTLPESNITAVLQDAA